MREFRLVANWMEMQMGVKEVFEVGGVYVWFSESRGLRRTRTRTRIVVVWF